ncbi:MAG: NAD(P)H-dependent oxidoreductase [Pseudomonadales bacterium]|nr:NAD(P)H-dependent oxidoreductase [Pseudomonadales bacterium]
MNAPLRVALLYGSTREGRTGDQVVAWAAEQIRRDDRFELDVIDPLDHDLPAHFPAGEHEGMAQLTERLQQADAILIATPEYNHSFPAPLKQVIDLTGEAWQARPVAFISYGGVSGGLRAVEQLRQVFAELHAVTLRQVVSFMNVWQSFDKTGTLQNPARANQRLATLLTQLQWWARTLRQGREQQPYGAIL